MSWSLPADVTRRSPRRLRRLPQAPSSASSADGWSEPAGTSAHEPQTPEEPADGAPSSAVDGALRRAADPAVRARAPVLVGLGRMPTHARRRGRGGAGRCCARIRHQPTGIVRNGHRGDVRQRRDAGGRRQHERTRGPVLTALRPRVRKATPPRCLVAHSGSTFPNLRWLAEPRFQIRRRREGEAIPRTDERRSCCGDRAGMHGRRPIGVTVHRRSPRSAAPRAAGRRRDRRSPRRRRPGHDLGLRACPVPGSAAGSRTVARHPRGSVTVRRSSSPPSRSISWALMCSPSPDPPAAGIVDAALQHVVPERGPQAGPLVAHLDDDPVPRPVPADGDRRPRRVPVAVGEQVGDHLGEHRGVAARAQRLASTSTVTGAPADRRSVTSPASTGSTAYSARGGASGARTRATRRRGSCAAGSARTARPA